MRLPSDATLIVVDDRRAASRGLMSAPDDAVQERRCIGALVEVWRSVSLPIICTDGLDDAVSSNAEAVLPSPSRDWPMWGRREGASVFSAPGLGACLDEHGCTTLIVCGFDTDGGVEASVRQAADLGFRIFVVADACAAAPKVDGRGVRWSAQDVHALSLTRMAERDVRIVDMRSAWVAAKSAGWGKR